MKVLKRIILITLILLIAIGSAVYAAIVANAPDVSYNKNGTTVSVKQELDDLYEKALKPKIGDIVNYNANASNAAGTAFGTPYKYTTSNSGANGTNQNTGDSTESTFSSADDMVWKILYIDKDDGVIRLIAADGTPQTLTLKGPAGYAYSVNILDSASAVYGHGYGATSARSVRVEDINQVTGYDPVANGKGLHTQTYTKNGYYVDLEYASGNTGTVTTYNRDDGTSTYGKVTADSYYNYTGTTYLANTTNSYKMIFQNTSGSNRSYWLASRGVYFGSVWCYFDVRYVNDGYVRSYSLCRSGDSVEYDSSIAVCPVVSLNSNIQLSYVSTSDGISTWNIQ